MKPSTWVKEAIPISLRHSSCYVLSVGMILSAEHHSKSTGSGKDMKLIGKTKPAKNCTKLIKGGLSKFPRSTRGRGGVTQGVN